MNSLSWFIYLANVFGSIKFIAVFVAIVLGLSLAAGLLFNAMEHDRFWGRGMKLLAPWVLVMFFIIALIPSKETMYLIGASEIGERLAKTDAASQIANDAHDIIRDYLKKARSELGVDDKKK